MSRYEHGWVQVRDLGAVRGAGIRTKLAAEIPEFLPLILEFQPLIWYGYRLRRAAP